MRKGRGRAQYQGTGAVLDLVDASGGETETTERESGPPCIPNPSNLMPFLSWAELRGEEVSQP